MKAIGSATGVQIVATVGGTAAAAGTAATVASTAAAVAGTAASTATGGGILAAVGAIPLSIKIGAGVAAAVAEALVEGALRGAPLGTVRREKLGGIQAVQMGEVAVSGLYLAALAVPLVQAAVAIHGELWQAGKNTAPGLYLILVETEDLGAFDGGGQ